ncbi:MAG: hypothetical protein IKL32_03110 [Alphaproteobacteria bacterium]|nr:hypothetical protein [Alphaproteobacteria bacterium]
MSDNQKISDLCDELLAIEEKRKQRTQGKNSPNQNKKRAFKFENLMRCPAKAGILMGLYAIGVLAVVGTVTHYACQKIEEKYTLAEQNHLRELLGQINGDTKREICQKYDGELLMLINDYQSGKKLNGFKMSPRNAVFSAHSDLLYKYGAYNPDIHDKTHTLEDWILLDHMCYRYYQYRDMELSNARNEVKNPYADMLRSELIEPSKKRVPVRHDNLFEGLKLDNVMKR